MNGGALVVSDLVGIVWMIRIVNLAEGTMVMDEVVRQRSGD
jgi:hypothetical protein